MRVVEGIVYCLYEALVYVLHGEDVRLSWIKVLVEPLCLGKARLLCCYCHCWVYGLIVDGKKEHMRVCFASSLAHLWDVDGGDLLIP